MSCAIAGVMLEQGYKLLSCFFRLRNPSHCVMAGWRQDQGNEKASKGDIAGHDSLHHLGCHHPSGHRVALEVEGEFHQAVAEHIQDDRQGAPLGPSSYSWCWSSTIDHRLVESRTTTTISTIWISHVGTIRRKWKIWSSCWLERVIRFLVTQRFGHGYFQHLPIEFIFFTSFNCLQCT